MSVARAGPLPEEVDCYSSIHCSNDLRVIVPDTLHVSSLRYMAEDLSRRTQKPVKVFHNSVAQKFRLCLWGEGTTPSLGRHDFFFFECDVSARRDAQPSQLPLAPARNNGQAPAARERPAIYDRHHSAELKEEDPNMDEEEIALLVATMWECEPEEEKAIWEQWAKEEAEPVGQHESAPSN
ncbi:homeobox and C2H2 transcription factor [Purpureocillium lavendulum]|uniref:Homeobox and C2H2 transcription factor n=1 Tax=Purpureocillium lavendulum TaxID=1247861 RepID=A0AB34FXK1_9HYPO|nr:homeobox and C2H2 transcription factor [Purpureocillium lavendulum]